MTAYPQNLCHVLLLQCIFAGESLKYKRLFSLLKVRKNEQQKYLLLRTDILQKTVIGCP